MKYERHTPDIWEQPAGPALELYLAAHPPTDDLASKVGLSLRSRHPHTAHRLLRHGYGKVAIVDPDKMAVDRARELRRTLQLTPKQIAIGKKQHEVVKQSGRRLYDLVCVDGLTYLRFTRADILAEARDRTIPGGINVVSNIISRQNAENRDLIPGNDELKNFYNAAGWMIEHYDEDLSFRNTRLNPVTRRVETNEMLMTWIVAQRPDGESPAAI